MIEGINEALEIRTSEGRVELPFAPGILVRGSGPALRNAG